MVRSVHTTEGLGKCERSGPGCDTLVGLRAEKRRISGGMSPRWGRGRQEKASTQGCRGGDGWVRLAAPRARHRQRQRQHGHGSDSPRAPAGHPSRLGAGLTNHGPSISGPQQRKTEPKTDSRPAEQTDGRRGALKVRDKPIGPETSESHPSSRLASRRPHSALRPALWAQNGTALDRRSMSAAQQNRCPYEAAVSQFDRNGDGMLGFGDGEFFALVVHLVQHNKLQADSRELFHIAEWWTQRIASHPGFAGQAGATAVSLRDAALADLFEELTPAFKAFCPRRPVTARRQLGPRPVPAPLSIPAMDLPLASHADGPGEPMLTPPAPPARHAGAWDLWSGGSAPATAPSDASATSGQQLHQQQLHQQQLQHQQRQLQQQLHQQQLQLQQRQLQQQLHQQQQQEERRVMLEQQKQLEAHRVQQLQQFPQPPQQPQPQPQYCFQPETQISSQQYYQQMAPNFHNLVCSVLGPQAAY